MGHNKSINHVFTFVIIVIFFVVENSNANICLDQITSIEQIDKDSSGKNVFLHTYNFITVSVYSRDINYAILYHYLETILEEAVSDYPNDILLNPLNWCKENQHTFRIKIFPYNIESSCKEIMKKAGYNIKKDGKEALKYSYMHKRSDLKKASGPGRQYFNYLIKEFLKSINENLNLTGPMAYCHRECMYQITQVGRVPENSTGLEAFEYLYRNYHPLTVESIRDDIFKEYLNNLFDAATLFNVDDTFEAPAKWCDTYNKRMGYNEIYCLMDLRFGGIDGMFTASQSLKHAFLYIISMEELNDVLRKYYNYMFEACKPFIANSPAVGPDVYCSLTYSSYSNTSLENQDINQDQPIND